jgi:hypothetical protein
MGFAVTILWSILWFLGAGTLVFVAFVAMFVVLQEDVVIRWPGIVRWLAALAIAACLGLIVYRYAAADWMYFAVMSAIAIVGWRFFRGFAKGFVREFVASFKASIDKHKSS